MFHRTHLLLHAREQLIERHATGKVKGREGEERMGIRGGGEGVGGGMMKGDAHKCIIAVSPLPASGPSPRARYARRKCGGDDYAMQLDGAARLIEALGRSTIKARFLKPGKSVTCTLLYICVKWLGGNKAKY